ncbi:DUF2479 domain-containing protein [Bacillus mycoides]|nr:DUF2479 domain-containing protein [Bacillus mycoides]
MTFKTRELTVDLINEVSTNEIRFSQGDKNSAKLVLNITNQGQELDLSQATAVRITFEKTDGKIVFQQDCQPINAMKGKYQIVLKTQTLAVIGNVLGQVTIFEGDREIDSQVFVFTVKRSLSSDEAIESKNEITIIKKALEVGEQFKGVDFAPIIKAGATAEQAKAAAEQNATQIGILSENISLTPTYLPKRNRITKVVTSFQGNHGFTKQSVAGAQSDDTTDYALGMQSLQITTDGDGKVVFSRNTSIGAIDATKKQILVTVKVKNIQRVNELTLFLFSNKNLTDYYVFSIVEAPATRYWLNEDEWATITLNFASAAVFGNPNRADITGLQLRVVDKSNGAVTAHCNSIALIDEPPQGVISITMDDGLLTQYTEARPIMDKYGFPATAYTITDRVGADDTKFMTLDMLKKLRDANGWEIAAHAGTMGVHEARYINITENQMNEDLKVVRNWLVKHGFQAGAEHFAYPGGTYDSTVLAYMRKYFGSARTISEKNHETFPPADPHRLRIVNVVNTMTIEKFKSHVDKCLENHTWLIFCYHQFVEPALFGTQVTPANFEAQMEYIAAKGIPVRTIGDMIRHGV